MSVYRITPIVLAASLASCSYDRYQIRMQPDGESVERQITCARINTQKGKTANQAFPEEKLAEIAKLYEKRVTPPEALEHTFVGRFKGKLPNSVGGAGFYSHFASSLGSVSSYTERFGGNDDPHGMIEKAQMAADQLTEILIGWLGSELKDDPNLKRLREFLDVRVRHDLKNAALYVWVAEIGRQDGGKGLEEALVRICQYLVEREYFSQDQVPALLRLTTLPDSSDGELALFRRLVAHGMGVPLEKPVPASLSFLTDQERAEESLSRYLKTTETHRKRMADWQQAKKADPKAPEPSPDDIMSELFEDLAQFSLFGSDDRVDVALACATEPFSTNGKWDPEKKQVTWSSGIPDEEFLSVFRYALWTAPDEKAQIRQFGKTALSGEELMEYAIWRNALNADEGKEWDEFLSTLRPGEAMKEKLGSFAFSAKTEDVKDQKAMAKAGCELISGALGE